MECKYDWCRKLACHNDNHLQLLRMFLALKHKQASTNFLLACIWYRIESIKIFKIINGEWTFFIQPVFLYRATWISFHKPKCLKQTEKNCSPFNKQSCWLKRNHQIWSFALGLYQATWKKFSWLWSSKAANRISDGIYLGSVGPSELWYGGRSTPTGIMEFHKIYLNGCETPVFT